MSKNQKKEEQSKIPETALKTGSEKKESAKKKAVKGPELNEPMFDVTLNEYGAVDNVVSEKAIEEIDYPPELSEFLGEAIAELHLHEQLGLDPGEPLPEEVITEAIKTILSNVDLGQLLQALKDSEFESKEDNITSLDDLTDEEIAKADFSELDKDEYGNTLLGTFDLVGPEEAEDYTEFIFPALPGDENAKKCRLVVHIKVPYLEKVSLDELPTSEEVAKMDSVPRYITKDHQNYYRVAEETYHAFLEAARECGLEGADDPPEEIEVHPDGYDPEMMEYWYGGEIYHEKDVIWFEIPRTISMMGSMKGFSANLDNFIGLYESCDISRVKNIVVKDFKRVLSKMELFEIAQRHQNPAFFEQLTYQEMVFHLAREFAKTKEEAGYCIVCLNGKYYVPVESIFNPVTMEFEDLIVAFNVVNCYPSHHKCCGLIVADVGNMPVHTSVRYHKGGIFDWQKRINQEIAAYRLMDADYNPYDDPYDDPKNAYDGPFDD